MTILPLSTRKWNPFPFHSIPFHSITTLNVPPHFIGVYVYRPLFFVHMTRHLMPRGSWVHCIMIRVWDSDVFLSPPPPPDGDKFKLICITSISKQHSVLFQFLLSFAKAEARSLCLDKAMLAQGGGCEATDT